MKKYITLFSLIGLFFIGIQNTQAQELQKRSLDESQGKDKREQITKMKKEKSLEEIKSIPFSFCVFQLYSLNSLATFCSSSSFISLFQNFSNAFLSSLLGPILG